MNSFNSYNANLNKRKNVTALQIMVNNQLQNIIPTSGVYTLYLKSTATFSINKSIPIDFTLVSGGGGCGTGNGGICGAGGGGGHVFNYYGYNVTASTAYYFNIGTGGTAINGYTSGSYSNKTLLDTYIKMTNSSGATAQDSNSNLLTTTFSTYGGGGGQGYGGRWWDGMGGNGSLSQGGLSTTITNYAPGGGGGVQTVIKSGTRTNNSGNKGSNSISTSGGAGGEGHTGIDNNYYGGGGAGGAMGTTNPGAIGGKGGGQNGNNFTASTPTGRYNINGTPYVLPPRTGAIGEQGGGGGGVVTNSTGYNVVQTPETNFVIGTTGAEGIAIIKIKYP